MKRIISADLGQSQDWTAICIAELDGNVLNVRHLERPRLGTSYPVICERLGELVRDLTTWETRRKPMETYRESYQEVPDLIIDATGVGRPVVDLLTQAGLRPISVTITGGEAETGGVRDWHVPKRVLVSSLQIFLQSDRLKISKALPLAEVLVKELLEFTVKISTSGSTSFEALRARSHDDLVLATAQACWWASRPGPAGIQTRFIAG